MQHPNPHHGLSQLMMRLLTLTQWTRPVRHVDARTTQGNVVVRRTHRAVTCVVVRARATASDRASSVQPLNKRPADRPTSTVR